ncbi:MAG: PucR family transcriptional regulator ligand-binding domain-containing protein [Microbacterium sp.]|uniref:PucR family transcriptional regulator n=1 Tax=Microbacterium sp. TaxID=51671 RepID=UPI001AD4B49D|nr:PucR family transcriptional regulator [Microbacterium sp.]MBN9173231.1 PucR family transcriptional regulator ligand-binding domain-containing protein [Microbacterium sp.]
MADADTPTLRALLARPGLRLQLAFDESELAPGALDQPVRWVHNSDLLDPTPFLSDGLALLTTGTQFVGTDDPSVFSEYVRRLTLRGVLALGFGTEVVRAGVPPLLIAACRSARMPLFEVPYRTPFIAVARANAEAIAAQAYARRSWALAAQRAIALAALRPDGLTATLAELARQLDAWVGLFDTAGNLANEHPAGAVDAATAAVLSTEVAGVLRRGVRTGSALRIGDTPFTLQTLGRGGHLRGVIAIAAGELDQEGRGVVTAVIAMAGLALEQNEGIARARTLMRAGVLQSLLSDDPTLARRIARDLWGGLPAAPLAVAAAGPGAEGDAVTEWLELRADETPGRLFFGHGDGGLVLVVPADDEHVLEALADRFDVRLGVSLPAAYGGFARALTEAETALRRGTPRVARFAEVAASGVLNALDTEAGRALAHAAIEPLVRQDAAEGSALVETVRAWLEHDARFDAAAAALGVHRHTVRARVAQAQRLLGTDLGTFAARAELWAALRLLP